MGFLARLPQSDLRPAQSVTFNVSNGLRRAVSFANPSHIGPILMLVGITAGITAWAFEQAEDSQFNSHEIVPRSNILLIQLLNHPSQFHQHHRDPAHYGELLNRRRVTFLPQPRRHWFHNPVELYRLQVV
jgi:hypothetical protein